jgi:putative transposase
VARNRIDALEDFRKQLEGSDVDLPREIVKVFAEQLMGADADAFCGADYGERSLNGRTGATATGSEPGTRGPGRSPWPSRSCARARTSPSGCWSPRRRAERLRPGGRGATCSVCRPAASKAWWPQLGIERISKSRASEMAKELDEAVEAFRTRPLDGGPYTLRMDGTLTQKVLMTDGSFPSLARPRPA